MRAVILLAGVLLVIILSGCADKSKLVYEQMSKIADSTKYNETNNSYVYTVDIKNVPHANRILNDVFGEVSISDTAMFFTKVLAIENIYRQIDFSAYAVQLSNLRSIIIVCRTTDFDRAINHYRSMFRGATDSTGTNPFIDN